MMQEFDIVKVWIGSNPVLKLSHVKVCFGIQSGTWTEISFVPLAGCPT
jgi:hypothetical protein